MVSDCNLRKSKHALNVATKKGKPISGCRRRRPRINWAGFSEIFRSVDVNLSRIKGVVVINRLWCEIVEIHLTGWAE